MIKSMSFKELSAWITMIVCVIAGAAYFVICYLHWLSTSEWIVPLVPFFVLTAIMIVFLIPPHIITAIVKRGTANEPDDERDNTIRYKAGYHSGYCLGFLLVTALVISVLNTNAFLLFHMIVACLLISQIVEYASQIVFYRRSSALGEDI